MNQVSLKDALFGLTKEDSPFKTVFEHGTLAVEIYKPEKVDLQEPHSRDEVYIVATGRGTFIHEKESRLVNQGDFLFVPAGHQHRFVDFTPDFSTWVLFYGPEGGE